ncbi:MAG: dihydropteroate synthase [Pseudomonadota bacterium]
MREFLLRPICETTAGDDGAALAGGPVIFRRVETISFDRSARRLPLKSIAQEALIALTGRRQPICGLTFDRPRLMGVLNATPDSFSDGGADETVAAAIERGLQMARDGADLIDIGGESTRPGADIVDPAEEQDRVLPVIEGLRAAGLTAPISIDTRNASTARAAVAAGAQMFNDVSALTHDADSLAFAVESGAAVCLMHAQGDPKTMQDAPGYRNVLIEVYSWLEDRVAACIEAGVPKEKIVIDPGVGFGKTMAHNLALISGLAAFQGLGCAVMLGASRKRFIGTLSGQADPAARGPGSIGAAIAAAGQAAQILRVHDVAMTREALDVWSAAAGLRSPEDQGA